MNRLCLFSYRLQIIARCLFPEGYIDLSSHYPSLLPVRPLKAHFLLHPSSPSKQHFQDRSQMVGSRSNHNFLSLKIRCSPQNSASHRREGSLRDFFPPSQAIVKCFTLRDSTNKFIVKGRRGVPALPSDTTLELPIALTSILAVEPDLLKEYFENVTKNLRIQHNPSSSKNSLVLV